MPVNNLGEGFRASAVQLEPLVDQMSKMFALVPETRMAGLPLFHNFGLDDLTKLGNISTSLSHVAALVLCGQLLALTLLRKTRLSALILVDDDRIHETLLKNFQSFQEHPYSSLFAVKLLDLLPTHDKQINSALQTAITIIDGLDFAEVQSHVGYLYTHLLAASDRKQYSAYFTKPEAALLLATLCLPTTTSDVYDPTCGSGVLLAASYQRNRYLANKVGQNVPHLIAAGTDISNVACFFAVLTLVALDPSGSNISPEIKNIDFFSAPPRNSSALLANPPFTRADRLKKDYKDWLVSHLRANGVEVKLDRKQVGLHGYMLLKIDQFLQEKGRAGLIIPLSVLYTSSFQPILEHLHSSFGVIYLVKSDLEPAFSDSTFEEVILIVEKGYTGSFRVLRLRTCLSELSEEEIYNFGDRLLTRNDKGPVATYHSYPQMILSRWRWSFALSAPLLLEVWDTIEHKGKPLSEFGNPTRGNRVAPIELFGLPNKNWKLSTSSGKFLTATHQVTGQSFVFEKNVDLFRSMKRYNEMARYPSILEGEGPESYYVRHSSSRFQDWAAVNPSFRRQLHYPPIDRMSHLGIPQKISWGTTRSLVFFSPTPLHVGDGFVTVQTDRRTSFWLFAFFLSTFGLLTLFLVLRTINRSFGQLLGPDLAYIRVPHRPNLSYEEENQLDQLVRAVATSDVVANKPTLLDTMLVAWRDKTSPQHRLDQFFAHLLELQPSTVTNLYQSLYEELRLHAKD